MNDKPKNEEAEDQGCDILEVIQMVNKGRSYAELSDSLKEVVRMVRDTGKQGTLTYTLKIAPVKGSDGEQIQIEDDIKVKLPKPSRRMSFWFTDAGGGMHRSPVNQMLLVDEDTNEARAINE